MLLAMDILSNFWGRIILADELSGDELSGDELLNYYLGTNYPRADHDISDELKSVIINIGYASSEEKMQICIASKNTLLCQGSVTLS
jgi:hypothetical protein